MTCGLPEQARRNRPDLLGWNGVVADSRELGMLPSAVQIALSILAAAPLLRGRRPGRRGRQGYGGRPS